MGNSTRVKSILSKSISIVVILLNLVLVTATWIIQDDLSSGIVAIFTEVDNVAQVLRNGIARVEPEVRRLRQLIAQVEAASEEIAANVSEEGIVLRLLPDDLVDGLTTSAQSLQENFMAVYGLLETTSDVLLAVGKIPFVDIPANGLSTIESLQGSMNTIAEQVTSLSTGIGELRIAAGERIARVTAAADFLGGELDQFLENLIDIDADLETIQTRAIRFQRLTPPAIITTAMILTLLSGWVVYTQVVMIIRSMNTEREGPAAITDESNPPVED